MHVGINDRAVIGGNSPPDPIDEAEAPFRDAISEAENWLDGDAVESEAQMRAVDALIKSVKNCRRTVDAARDTATKPLHEAWKAETARWKPTQDDLDRIVNGLIAAVDAFKRKLAAEKAEAARKAREEAEAKLRAAQDAHRAADPANIEAQRAAAAAEREAESARIKAAVAAKDTVKGMRLTWFHEVTSLSALLRWINTHDRAALDAFAEEYARTHRQDGIARDGMRAWQERVAA